jgi:lipid II:glycine glycyltransferase (peptidoglycan interpeptide bridge formation enzyme)
VGGRPLFTELRNMSDLSDQQAVLNDCGFQHEGHLNYLIDLSQPEETLWKNISRTGRQHIRAALRSNATVEVVEDREQVALAYSFLQKVYARVQVPLASCTLFEAVFDVMAPCQARILLARVGEQFVGTCVLLLHKQNILAWYLGVDRAFSACGPGEFLVWHVLKWGKEHGFRTFDWGGAGKPDQEYGPRRFKKKFGGNLVNYGRNICVHTPRLLKLSTWGYGLFRKLL